MNPLVNAYITMENHHVQCVNTPEVAILNSYVLFIPQLSMKVFDLWNCSVHGRPILPIEGEPREFTESTEPGADWDGIRREISAAIIVHSYGYPLDGKMWKIISMFFF